MVATPFRVDIPESLGHVGPVQLECAVWWTAGSPLAVLEYSIGGQKRGLRVDLEKCAIFDTVGNSNHDNEIIKRLPMICDAVSAARRNLDVV